MLCNSGTESGTQPACQLTPNLRLTLTAETSCQEYTHGSRIRIPPLLRLGVITSYNRPWLTEVATC